MLCKKHGSIMIDGWGYDGVLLLTAISIQLHGVRKVSWYGAGRVEEVDLGQEWGLVLFDYCPCLPC